MTTSYKDKYLYFDNYKLDSIVDSHQTPFYLYSKNIITQKFLSYKQNLPENSLICFSVKANSNLTVLSLLAKLGSGFDIVSSGELQRVLKAGGDPSKIVFSGVGKTEVEIDLAIKNNILCFNVESKGELLTINSVAKKLNKQANISLRINPAINVKTHPYITTGMSENKFGINQNESIDLYLDAKELSNIQIKGIDFHIGSQITDIEPYEESLYKILDIIKKLKENDIGIEHLDIGGGLGITYNNEKPPSVKNLINTMSKIIKPLNIKLIMEPGRSIVAESGILVSKVLYVKKTPTKNFLIVDLGMNDFMRPPLYDAFHVIKELKQTNDDKLKYDVVGPICESADFSGKSRSLAIKADDYIAIENVGAYGFVLASNYNSRLKPAELMIVDGKIITVRKRETMDQLLCNEEIGDT